MLKWWLLLAKCNFSKIWFIQRKMKCFQTDVLQVLNIYRQSLYINCNFDPLGFELARLKEFSNSFAWFKLNFSIISYFSKRFIPKDYIRYTSCELWWPFSQKTMIEIFKTTFFQQKVWCFIRNAKEREIYFWNFLDIDQP